jgi:lipid-binding SYLF domain-containing protein
MRRHETPFAPRITDADASPDGEWVALRANTTICVDAAFALHRSCTLARQEELRMKLRVALPMMLAVCVLGASVAQAVETDRLRASAEVLKALRAAPDDGIPEELWNRAECVVVIPSMKKAAFIFGGEYGRGVMSCRTANGWSAPLYMQLAKGSWGLQIGAEAVDLVLMVMNRQGIDTMLNNKISLGADAAVAAGPVGRQAAASTDGQLNAQILSYSRSKGVFAGIDLSGGVLRPDEDANVEAYGKAKTPKDVLTGANAATDVATRDFMNALGRDVRATTGRR